jgi:signal recognition particle GTPase
LRSACEFVHLLVLDAALTLSRLVTRQSNDGLSAQIAGQEQLIQSLGGSEAQNVRTPELVNEYFMTPQSVSNLFVGRKLELLQLKQVRSEREPAQSTMRVVIYGINGSGKTEFCYKFAQDNRSRLVVRRQISHSFN